MGLFFLAIATILGTSNTSAQTISERELSISPLRTELVVAKGTTKTGALTVYNTGRQSLSIQMGTQTFTVTDEEYNYSFDENATVNQWVRYSAANFILEAGKSKEIEYSINVPNTANPGDTYFGMFASTTPSKTDSEISSTERVASLIYVTVPGNITRSGKLLNIRSPFITNSDSTWSATIQNSGNALFRSNYSVSVQTLWNQELIKKDGNALILANSVRLISDTLPMPQWLGIYKVVYSIELGDDSKAVATHSLLYVPIPQLILLLTLLLAVLLPFISRHRKTSSKKKKISSSEE